MYPKREPPKPVPTAPVASTTPDPNAHRTPKQFTAGDFGKIKTPQDDKYYPELKKKK